MAEAPIEILVVEDNDIVRESLVGFCEDNFKCNGLRVNSAENGEEAAGKVNERSIVLLDIDMPVMNGYGFLEYLARNSIKPMAIVVTCKRCSEPYGRADVERNVRRAYKGKVEFAPKPSTVEEFELFMGVVSSAVYGIGPSDD